MRGTGAPAEMTGCYSHDLRFAHALPIVFADFFFSLAPLFMFDAHEVTGTGAQNTSKCYLKHPNTVTHRGGWLRHACRITTHKVAAPGYLVRVGRKRVKKTRLRTPAHSRTASLESGRTPSEGAASHFGCRSRAPRTFAADSLLGEERSG